MEQDPAIQEDVDQVEQQEPEQEETEAPEGEETPRLERDNVMAEIAKRQADQRKEELGEDPDQPVSESNAPLPDKPQEEPELVPLKVSGRTIYRTQQQIDDAGGVAAIQKSIAGDIKLQDAANREKELYQREQEVQQKLRELEQRQQHSEAPEALKEASEDDLRQWAEDLTVGDVDKVASTLATVMNRSRSESPRQQIDPNAIANQAAEITRQQIAKENALQKFAQEFADINDHQGKRQLANEHTKILMREHPDWTPSQVLTEAGKRTRADLGVTPPKKETADPLTAKRHRKASTVDTIPQATARKVEASTDYKPKTSRQIFEDMEAARSH